MSKSLARMFNPFILLFVLLFAQLVFGRFSGFANALARSTGMIAFNALVLGCLLIFVAWLQLKANKRTASDTQDSEQLITKGLYRYSRHPMYLGMLLVLLVQPLLTLRPPLLIFTLAFFLIMNFWVIPREESKLQQLVGGLYEAYKAQTNRWLNYGFAITLLVLGCALPIALSL